MAVVDITTSEQINFSKDSIVIVNNLGTIAGGRTLDVTGFAPSVIQAGHVIIQADGGGEFKPLPVDNNLPASHSYKGILVASVLASKPFASIMTRGKVNENATPYGISAGVKSALSLIEFITD